MGVLMMLMTLGAVAVSALLLIIAMAGRKAWLAEFTLGAIVLWFGFYGLMLLSFSFVSSEKVVAMNNAKEFCGFYLDCHLHAAVTGVRTTDSIGERRANGEFRIVKVVVFSDARNPSIAFRLLEPKARMVMADGQMVERDPDAERLLPTAAISLGSDIRGRDQLEKEIVFDVPSGTGDAKLLITEGYGIDKVIEWFLIGDEDSLFHAQTFFALPEQSEVLSVK